MCCVFIFIFPNFTTYSMSNWQIISYISITKTIFLFVLTCMESTPQEQVEILYMAYSQIDQKWILHKSSHLVSSFLQMYRPLVDFICLCVCVCVCLFSCSELLNIISPLLIKRSCFANIAKAMWQRADDLRLLLTISPVVLHYP